MSLWERQEIQAMLRTMICRPARASDAATIQHIIRAANINPMSLDWHRFVVVEDNGETICIGRITPHCDGTRELASLAVIPSRQGQGIGSEIIRTLLAKETGVLY